MTRWQGMATATELAAQAAATACAPFDGDPDLREALDRIFWPHARPWH